MYLLFFCLFQPLTLFAQTEMTLLIEGRGFSINYARPTTLLEWRNSLAFENPQLNLQALRYPHPRGGNNFLSEEDQPDADKILANIFRTFQDCEAHSTPVASNPNARMCNGNFASAYIEAGLKNAQGHRVVDHRDGLELALFVEQYVRPEFSRQLRAHFGIQMIRCDRNVNPVSCQITYSNPTGTPPNERPRGTQPQWQSPPIVPQTTTPANPAIPTTPAG